MDRSGANAKLRVAAIDIGTNTCLMLIGELDPNKGMTILADEHAIVRLGENVDKSRKITDEAYARLSSTLTKYRSIIDELQVTDIAACGTSALRDALNRDEILARVKNDFDINISIIEGSREAELTYLGATFDLPPADGLTAVIDIGGGSTEIAFGKNT
ncbi:MAG TPA: Ppx/GppA family phosphatase, partial [Candidatus Kapabacteria bacterium]